LTGLLLGLEGIVGEDVLLALEGGNKIAFLLFVFVAGVGLPMGEVTL